MAKARGLLLTLPRNPPWKTPPLENGNPGGWQWEPGHLGKTIYLQSSGNNGVGRTLVAVEAINGKILWSADLIGAKSKTHAKNSLASSTPACATEGIFSVFWNGENLLVPDTVTKGTCFGPPTLGLSKVNMAPGTLRSFMKAKYSLTLIRTTKPKWLP